MFSFEYPDKRKTNRKSNQKKRILGIRENYSNLLVLKQNGQFYKH